MNLYKVLIETQSNFLKIFAKEVILLWSLERTFWSCWTFQRLTVIRAETLESIGWRDLDVPEKPWLRWGGLRWGKMQRLPVQVVVANLALDGIRHLRCIFWSWRWCQPSKLNCKLLGNLWFYRVWFIPRKSSGRNFSPNETRQKNCPFLDFPPERVFFARLVSMPPAWDFVLFAFTLPFFARLVGIFARLVGIFARITIQ